MGACGKCGSKKGHLTGCPVLDKLPEGKKKKGRGPLKQNTQRGLWISVTCPTCGGSGKRGIRNCGLCNGRGKILVPKE